MKPLLKWAGGKRHIAAIIEAHFPQDWDKGTYFEPFLGGGAMFLHLQPSTARLSDVNTKLIGFYRDLSSQTDTLLSQIQDIATKFDSLDVQGKKDFYLEIRDDFNSTSPLYSHSASFYALNKLCFNGLYRENLKGNFNVPFGQKLSFPSVQLDDFYDAAAAFQKSKLSVCDFETTIAEAVEGDFVYFDPPYVPMTPTASFTAYTAEGFGLESQQRLAQAMKDLQRKGVKAIASNSSTSLTSEIYEGLNLKVIQAPRMVGAKSSSRGKIDELLISNF